MFEYFFPMHLYWEGHYFLHWCDFLYFYPFVNFFKIAVTVITNYIFGKPTLGFNLENNNNNKRSTFVMTRRGIEGVKVFLILGDLRT